MLQAQPVPLCSIKVVLSKAPLFRSIRFIAHLALQVLYTGMYAMLDLTAWVMLIAIDVVRCVFYPLEDSPPSPFCLACIFV